MSETRNDTDWNALVKLGDMMGDGLHHEPGGAWISREYKKLSRALIPELRETEAKRRKEKNAKMDELVAGRLLIDKCDCGGQLKQSRSGSLVAQCTIEGCNKRYRYKAKKRKS